MLPYLLVSLQRLFSFMISLSAQRTGALLEMLLANFAVQRAPNAVQVASSTRYVAAIVVFAHKRCVFDWSDSGGTGGRTYLVVPLWAMILFLDMDSHSSWADSLLTLQNNP